MNASQIYAQIQAHNDRRLAALADRGTAAEDSAAEFFIELDRWAARRAAAAASIEKGAAYLAAFVPCTKRDRRTREYLLPRLDIALRPFTTPTIDVGLLVIDRDTWLALAGGTPGGIDRFVEEKAIADADAAAKAAFAAAAVPPAQPHELEEVRTMAVVARSRDPELEVLEAQCRRLLEYAEALQAQVPMEEPPVMSEMRNAL